MKTLVVILNYRTPDLTIQCLRSLCHEVVAANAHVTVVEGNSGDNSAKKIAAAIAQEEWEAWATLMVLADNRGYAAGNNAAIRCALASADPPMYVLILNPDTIVRQGAISALTEFMDQHLQAGIAGSRLEEPDGEPQVCAFRFPSIFSELDKGLRLGCVSRWLKRWRVAQSPFDRTTQVDWVAGASFMIRDAVFDEVGLLDEGYFLYYEELDFCLRAKRAGWECWHVPQSRVVHLIGQSTGVSRPDPQPKRRPAYWFESRSRYFQQNHGRLYAAVADLAWAAGFSLWRLRRILQRKPDTDPPHMLWDFMRYSTVIRTIIR